MNIRSGNLKLTKQDKENENIKLEGVVFGLYSEGNEKIGEYTTDANGEILVEDLKIGNYKLKELSTRTGYILNSQEIDVIVEYDNIVTITVENEKEKPKLPRTGF